jgi:carbon storage regulator
MLVLSRQRDETIMIGDDIEITVVDIRGDKVRLGINAPTRIAVHRKEVYEAIKAENQRASQISGADFSQLPSPGPMKRPRPASGLNGGPGLGPAARINPLPQNQLKPPDAKSA